MKKKALAIRSKKVDINTLIEEICGTQLDMFESYVSIGIKLAIIKEDKLFETEGYGDFSSFLKDQQRHGFQFTPGEAWQCVRISEVVGAIKQVRDKQPEDLRNQIPVPTSQSQIKPLMKLPDSRAADTWISGAIHANKVNVPLTNRFFADFVNHTEKIVDATPIPANQTNGEKEESETDRDYSIGGETQSSPFSAEALECLNKIESLQPHTLPEDARSSIEQDLINGVNNYALELWNRHAPSEFKAIGRLVFFREMTFDQAQRFVMRPIGPQSTVVDLIHGAVAFGGVLRLKVDEDRFLITVTQTADQPIAVLA